MSQPTAPVDRVLVFHRPTPHSAWVFVGATEGPDGVSALVAASGLTGTWWALTDPPYPGEERTPETLALIAAARGTN